jgi:hypothetical protein
LRLGGLFLPAIVQQHLTGGLPKQGEAKMIKQIIKVVLRALGVILIGLVSAVIGFILGAIIIGTLSPFYELVFGYEFVFNGREGYEAGGPIGFILGALTGLIASGVRLFGKRTRPADFQGQ